jgi:NAD(P)-dependent dehydrogenase (short-subunit alcohol dehydrogenase family)
MPGQISFDLKRKTVMITGAGRGIGKAIALACAPAGVDLALGSRHMWRSTNRSPPPAAS